MSRITAPPLDLSTALGHSRNRVRCVGIELEGGWDVLPRGVELVRDSSVVFTSNITPTELARLTRLYDGFQRGEFPIAGRNLLEQEYYTLVNKRDGHGISYVGEYPSVPLKVKGGEWKTWLRSSYPPHINHTCGMHVHMSFWGGDLIYQRLMEEDFSSTILRYIERWAAEFLPLDHHIWGRLRGESEYCQHLFHADQQVKLGRKRFEHHEAGHRYTIINYPYLQHKTIECRLLPMMADSETAVNLIQYLLDVVNAYIVVKYPAREVRKTSSHVIELPATDNGFEQTYAITV